MQAAQDDEVRLSSQRGEEEVLRSFPPRGRPPCRPAEAAKLTRDSSRVRMRFHSEWRSLVQTAGLLEAQLTENAFLAEILFMRPFPERYSYWDGRYGKGPQRS